MQPQQTVGPSLNITWDFHKNNLKAPRQITETWPDLNIIFFFKCLGIRARFHHQMADKTNRQAGENERLAP